MHSPVATSLGQRCQLFLVCLITGGRHCSNLRYAYRPLGRLSSSEVGIVLCGGVVESSTSQWARAAALDSRRSLTVAARLTAPFCRASGSALFVFVPPCMQLWTTASSNDKHHEGHNQGVERGRCVALGHA